MSGQLPVSNMGSNGHPHQGDWRKGSADIKILLKNLYSQPSMSHTDVIFKFPSGERIAAHKLILTLFSPVFEAEFYGSLNQDGEILITDIEPEIFKMLLGYLYTSIPLDVKDKDFDCSKAWNLWYATEKYILPELSESCKLKIQQCVQNHDHYTLLNLVNAVKYHISDYITFHATEKVNKALESLIHTREWRDLEEYVFVHILAQENLSLTEGQLFQAILNWCTAQVDKELSEGQPKKEAVREKLSRFLEFIKWENMSGEEFVELASSDVLSLEQYRTFSLRIFRANFKGRRSMTREMSNPLRVYRKAIPCPSVRAGGVGFFMRSAPTGSAAADVYDATPDNSPSPRVFHTFRFPHITVEVETTPQCVQFKHELEPQSQLCLNFKTMLLLANIAGNNGNSTAGYNSTGQQILSGGRLCNRIQVFASVILENQVERSRSVFKRMRIADTNSLASGSSIEPAHVVSGRFAPFPSVNQPAGKKSKFGSQQQQQYSHEGGVLYGYGMMASGAFFQSGGGGGGGQLYGQVSANSRRTTPPLRQNMFLIPIARLEDKKSGFLLRNKTISLNVCIDIRDVYSIKLVREAAWSSLDGAPSMETITVAKTSLLTDIQAAVEKELGLEVGSFRLWWKCFSGSEGGVLCPVPQDSDCIWEKTEHFVPAIPTAFEQETDLILYVEDVEKGRPDDPEVPRILVFLKIYDPSTKTLQNASKVYPLSFDTDSLSFPCGAGFRDMVLEASGVETCRDMYLINRRTEALEKLTFEDSRSEVRGENGDICVVELAPSLPQPTTFDDFYETLRNSKEILLKSKVESGDYPSEFRLMLSLNTTCRVLKHQVRQHLLATAPLGPQGERIHIESLELYECYWTPQSGLAPRPAEFPVDSTFDGSVDDLLRSGSREEPMIFFKAVTRSERPEEMVDAEAATGPDETVPTTEEMPPLLSGEMEAGDGILVGGLQQDEEEEEEGPTATKRRKSSCDGVI